MFTPKICFPPIYIYILEPSWRLAEFDWGTAVRNLWGCPVNRLDSGSKSCVHHPWPLDYLQVLVCVVSFFEYGRVEEQATMEGKTLLNKSWALVATIFKSTEFVEEKEIRYAHAALKFRVQFKISWSFDEFKNISRDWAQEGKAWKPKGNLCIQS